MGCAASSPAVTIAQSGHAALGMRTQGKQNAAREVDSLAQPSDNPAIGSQSGSNPRTDIAGTANDSGAGIFPGVRTQGTAAPAATSTTPVGTDPIGQASGAAQSRNTGAMTTTFSWRRGDTLGCGSFGPVFLGLNDDSGAFMAAKEVPFSSEVDLVPIAGLHAAVRRLADSLAHPNIVRYCGADVIRIGETLVRPENMKVIGGVTVPGPVGLANPPTSLAASGEGAAVMTEVGPGGAGRLPGQATAAAPVLDGRVYILTEWVSGGSLKRMLSSFRVLPDNVVATYVLQILLALEYLHANGVAHGQLNTDNILMDSDGNLRVCDYGLTRGHGILSYQPPAAQVLRAALTGASEGTQARYSDLPSLHALAGSSQTNRDLSAAALAAVGAAQHPNGLTSPGKGLTRKLAGLMAKGLSPTTSQSKHSAGQQQHQQSQSRGNNRNRTSSGDGGLDGLRLAKEEIMANLQTFCFKSPEQIALQCYRSIIGLQAGSYALSLHPPAQLDDHAFATDIWALGALAITMATGQPPWLPVEAHDGRAPMPGASEDDGSSQAGSLHVSQLPALLHRIQGDRNGPPLHQLMNRTPVAPSPHLVDFVRQCFIPDPSKRPCASDLIRHPFIVELASRGSSRTSGGNSGRNSEQSTVISAAASLQPAALGNQPHASPPVARQIQQQQLHRPHQQLLNHHYHAHDAQQQHRGSGPAESQTAATGRSRGSRGSPARRRAGRGQAGGDGLHDAGGVVSPSAVAGVGLVPGRESAGSGNSRSEAAWRARALGLGLRVATDVAAGTAAASTPASQLHAHSYVATPASANASSSYTLHHPGQGVSVYHGPLGFDSFATPLRANHPQHGHVTAASGGSAHASVGASFNAAASSGGSVVGTGPHALPVSTPTPVHYHISAYSLRGGGLFDAYHGHTRTPRSRASSRGTSVATPAHGSAARSAQQPWRSQPNRSSRVQGSAYGNVHASHSAVSLLGGHNTSRFEGDGASVTFSSTSQGQGAGAGGGTVSAQMSTAGLAAAGVQDANGSHIAAASPAQARSSGSAAPSMFALSSPVQSMQPPANAQIGGQTQLHQMQLPQLSDNSRVQYHDPRETVPSGLASSNSANAIPASTPGVITPSATVPLGPLVAALQAPGPRPVAVNASLFPTVSIPASVSQQAPSTASPQHLLQQLHALDHHLLQQQQQLLHPHHAMMSAQMPRPYSVHPVMHHHQLQPTQQQHAVSSGGPVPASSPNAGPAGVNVRTAYTTHMTASPHSPGISHGGSYTRMSSPHGTAAGSAAGAGAGAGGSSSARRISASAGAGASPSQHAHGASVASSAASAATTLPTPRSINHVAIRFGNGGVSPGRLVPTSSSGRALVSMNSGDGASTTPTPAHGAAGTAIGAQAVRSGAAPNSSPASAASMSQASPAHFMRQPDAAVAQTQHQLHASGALQSSTLTSGHYMINPLQQQRLLHPHQQQQQQVPSHNLHHQHQQQAMRGSELTTISARTVDSPRTLDTTTSGFAPSGTAQNAVHNPMQTQHSSLGFSAAVNGAGVAAPSPSSSFSSPPLKLRASRHAEVHRTSSGSAHTRAERYGYGEKRAGTASPREGGVVQANSVRAAAASVGIGVIISEIPGMTPRQHQLLEAEAGAPIVHRRSRGAQGHVATSGTAEGLNQAALRQAHEMSNAQLALSHQRQPHDLFMEHNARYQLAVAAQQLEQQQQLADQRADVSLQQPATRLWNDVSRSSTDMMPGSGRQIDSTGSKQQQWQSVPGGQASATMPPSLAPQQASTLLAPIASLPVHQQLMPVRAPSPAVDGLGNTSSVASSIVSTPAVTKQTGISSTQTSNTSSRTPTSRDTQSTDHPIAPFHVYRGGGSGNSRMDTEGYVQHPRAVQLMSDILEVRSLQGDYGVDGEGQSNNGTGTGSSSDQGRRSSQSSGEISAAAIKAQGVVMASSTSNNNPGSGSDPGAGSGSGSNAAPAPSHGSNASVKLQHRSSRESSASTSVADGRARSSRSSRAVGDAAADNASAVVRKHVVQGARVPLQPLPSAPELRLELLSATLVRPGPAGKHRSSLESSAAVASVRSPAHAPEVIGSAKSQGSGSSAKSAITSVLGSPATPGVFFGQLSHLHPSYSQLVLQQRLQWGETPPTADSSVSSGTEGNSTVASPHVQQFPIGRGTPTARPLSQSDSSGQLSQQYTYLPSRLHEQPQQQQHHMVLPHAGVVDGIAAGLRVRVQPPDPPTPDEVRGSFSSEELVTPQSLASAAFAAAAVGMPGVSMTAMAQNGQWQQAAAPMDQHQSASAASAAAASSAAQRAAPGFAFVVGASPARSRAPTVNSDGEWAIKDGGRDWEPEVTGSFSDGSGSASASGSAHDGYGGRSSSSGRWRTNGRTRGQRRQLTVSSLQSPHGHGSVHQHHSRNEHDRYVDDADFAGEQEAAEGMAAFNADMDQPDYESGSRVNADVAQHRADGQGQPTDSHSLSDGSLDNLLSPASNSTGGIAAEAASQHSHVVLEQLQPQQQSSGPSAVVLQLMQQNAWLKAQLQEQFQQQLHHHPQQQQHIELSGVDFHSHPPSHSYIKALLLQKAGLANPKTQDLTSMGDYSRMQIPTAAIVAAATAAARAPPEDFVQVLPHRSKSRARDSTGGCPSPTGLSSAGHGKSGLTDSAAHGVKLADGQTASEMLAAMLQAPTVSQSGTDGSETSNSGGSQHAYAHRPNHAPSDTGSTRRKRTRSQRETDLANARKVTNESASAPGLANSPAGTAAAVNSCTSTAAGANQRLVASAAAAQPQIYLAPQQQLQQHDPSVAYPTAHASADGAGASWAALAGNLPDRAITPPIFPELSSGSGDKSKDNNVTGTTSTSTSASHPSRGDRGELDSSVSTSTSTAMIRPSAPPPRGYGFKFISRQRSQQRLVHDGNGSGRAPADASMLTHIEGVMAEGDGTPGPRMYIHGDEHHHAYVLQHGQAPGSAQSEYGYSANGTPVRPTGPTPPRQVQHTARPLNFNVYHEQQHDGGADTYADHLRGGSASHARQYVYDDDQQRAYDGSHRGDIPIVTGSGERYSMMHPRDYPPATIAHQQQQGFAAGAGTGHVDPSSVLPSAATLDYSGYPDADADDDEDRALAYRRQQHANRQLLARSPHHHHQPHQALVPGLDSMQSGNTSSASSASSAFVLTADARPTLLPTSSNYYQQQQEQQVHGFTAPMMPYGRPQPMPTAVDATHHGSKHYKARQPQPAGQTVGYAVSPGPITPARPPMQMASPAAPPVPQQQQQQQQQRRHAPQEMSNIPATETAPQTQRQLQPQAPVTINAVAAAAAVRQHVSAATLRSPTRLFSPTTSAPSASQDQSGATAPSTRPVTPVGPAKSAEATAAIHASPRQPPLQSIRTPSHGPAFPSSPTRIITLRPVPTTIPILTLTPTIPQPVPALAGTSATPAAQSGSPRSLAAAAAAAESGPSSPGFWASASSSAPAAASAATAAAESAARSRAPVPMSDVMAAVSAEAAGDRFHANGNGDDAAQATTAGRDYVDVKHDSNAVGPRKAPPKQLLRNRKHPSSDHSEQSNTSHYSLSALEDNRGGGSGFGRSVSNPWSGNRGQPATWYRSTGEHHRSPPAAVKSLGAEALQHSSPQQSPPQQQDTDGTSRCVDVSSGGVALSITGISSNNTVARASRKSGGSNVSPSSTGSSSKGMIVGKRNGKRDQPHAAVSRHMPAVRQQTYAGGISSIATAVQLAQAPASMVDAFASSVATASSLAAPEATSQTARLGSPTSHHPDVPAAAASPAPALEAAAAKPDAAQDSERAGHGALQLR